MLESGVMDRLTSQYTAIHRGTCEDNSPTGIGFVQTSTAFILIGGAVLLVAIVLSVELVLKYSERRKNRKQAIKDANNYFGLRGHLVEC